MSIPLLAVENLEYTYEDGTQALRGVNFRLYAGETVILLGANGSGKTTFLLHLNGLLMGRGRIQVAGHLLTAATLREVRARVGVVFQDADEQLFMPTVLEDIAFAPLNRGLGAAAAREKAQGILEQVGLAGMAGRAPYHLSSGEKRRAALAGVLAMDPDVLVLDEPTTFLDPPGQRVLTELIQRLPQPKIIATHDLEFARRVGTRAVFFQQGRIAGEGLVDAVIAQFRWDES
jgi:energy-coupling factor transporter ATP-binding protein EcfA2